MNDPNPKNVARPTGLVGKVLVVWLLLVGLVGVTALDAASIAITRSALRHGVQAATAGAANLRGQRTRDRVRDDAREAIEAQERTWCSVGASAR